ncbi:G-type lectin S-receptor-like serine/threonine-protein kinase [Glycine soja]|uniref:G-type lectin S-receptor-like serine/threonine-protein kinase n=1 Tax=Glycine soja TaxID=3848 RepID=A0A445JP56_GLYSO|nr:G-type lectin S-receptor-like serine/threonine-protein kinase [Glycine soja]
MTTTSKHSYKLSREKSHKNKKTPTKHAVERRRNNASVLVSFYSDRSLTSSGGKLDVGNGDEEEEGDEEENEVHPRVTEEVLAILDQAGSFGIVYGDSSDGAVYVYKNDGNDADLASAVHQSAPLTVLRILTLEKNGNLRLYQWRVFADGCDNIQHISSYSSKIQE